MISNFSGKKVFLILAMVVAIFAIPFTIYLSQQNQDNQSHATSTPETTVVVTINGKDYTKADVRQVAEEQFDPAAVDTQALQDALETLEERKILDAVAAEKGISVDPATVEIVKAGEDVSQTEAYYEILQQEVALTETKSVQAVSEGFWSPSSDYLTNITVDEKTLATNQSKQAAAVLAAINAGLASGKDPVEVYNAAVAKFPVVAPALALNGYIANDASDVAKSYYALPRVIQYGDSNLDPTVLNGLFAMNPGDVKTFTKTETNNGGAVFKVIKKGNISGPTTYDAWYAQEKINMVIPKGSL